MNIIILPFVTISFITIFKRSSNCPLYFVPATSAPRSRAITLLFKRFSGTSEPTILCARPSTIAVLPTPASPIRIGLFFVRLVNIWRTLSISSFLPITGSSLPSVASLVKSLPNSSNAGVLLFLSFSFVVVFSLRKRLMVSCLAARRLAPRLLNIFPPMPSSSRRAPRRRCSLPI